MILLWGENSSHYDMNWTVVTMRRKKIIRSLLGILIFSAIYFGMISWKIMKQPVAKAPKTKIASEIKYNVDEKQLKSFKKIRVLLLNDKNGQPFHKSITLKGKDGMEVTKGKKTMHFGKNDTLTISEKDVKKSKMVIKSSKSSGKITIGSMEKQGISPSYRGKITLTYRKNKGIIMVNELGIEEYLYAVIGSEMPISYGKDALKVQAVCARTYAYRQIAEKSFGEYEADVDDSISYQVYNNVTETKETRAAVKETKGKVLTYKGEVIRAYYFSTSCGHTASVEDVWQDGAVPYLTGKLQSKKEKNVDLSNEKAFRTFYKDKNFSSFDNKYPWYRWKTIISGQALGEHMKTCLEERYKKTPSFILTKQEDNAFVSKKISDIGKVKKLKVLKRGKSGIVKTMEIVGSKKTIKVGAEYNLRVLLAPVHETVYRADNTQMEEMTLLPSGFFFVEKDAKKDLFYIYGGGYGHGVGLSQNGAKAMLDMGYSYEKVLKHYYPGSKIVSILD